MGDSKQNLEISKDPKESVAAPEEELTEVDIDAAIAEEDPEFEKTINIIAKDKSLSMADIQLSEGEQALLDERILWEKGSKVAQKIVKFFPPIIYLSLVGKKLKYRLFSLSRALWIHLKNFTYDIAKIAKNKIIGGAKSTFVIQKNKVSKFKESFKYLPLKLKMAFFGIIFLVLFTALVFYRISTKGIVPTHFELFAPSMERYATEVAIYDPAKEVEPFYENLRAAGQIVLLPKMLVNLRPSKSSGKNPMAAVEFFVEGTTPEVAIEIKDKEVMVRDRLSRALEEFSFDIAESAEGKKQICEKLRKELNAMSEKGKIKKVWIKTIVIKP